jgi:hypothetical protein
MNLSQRSHKPRSVFNFLLLLLASIVATSAFAEAGLITFDDYTAWDVSADGGVIVGETSSEVSNLPEAFVWTPDGEMKAPSK